MLCDGFVADRGEEGVAGRGPGCPAGCEGGAGGGAGASHPERGGIERGEGGGGVR